MKIHITNEMKEKIITGSAIVGVALLGYFIMTQYPSIAAFFNQLISLLGAFIFGFGFAFLLNPIMMWIENGLFKNWKGKRKRVVSLLLAFIIAMSVIVGLVMLILNSTMESIKDLIDNYQAYLEEYTTLVTNFINNKGLDENWIESIVGTSDQILTMIKTGIPSLISTSYSIVGVVLNTLIGIVSGLYLLLDKEKLMGHAKRLTYAIFPEKIASYLQKSTKKSKDVFNNFIVGKAIDSLIIGILCYVGLSLLNIKYAGLLSVIVGMTNMIPVFGPFIGAIPGILLLLITSPSQCITFIIFIIVLQQFDGNILGPLILGDKLGLPSYWILFSVTIGGALFGILGMFLGVPVFAILYFMIKEFVNYRLKDKDSKQLSKKS